MRYTHNFSIKGLLCLFVCFISVTAVYGQSNSDFHHKKDSLLKVIASTKGEEKLKAYFQLTTRLFFPEEEIDLVLQYTGDFIREAHKQKNKEYESKAYYAELAYLYNNLKDDEFEQKANEYLPFFKNNGDHINYYTVYEKLLKSENIEDFRQMYADAKQENSLYGIAKAAFSMAQIYLIEQRYEEANKCFRETINNALKLIKEDSQPANYHLVSDGYNGLASTLLNQNKLNECFSLMSVWKKHTIAFEKTFGYSDPYLWDYYRIYSHIYILKEKYDEAELYCDSLEPIIISKRFNYAWDIKVRIHEGRKEYNSAIDLVDKLIDQSAILGDLELQAQLLEGKAELLSKMESLEAYSVLKKATLLIDSLWLIENNAQLDEIRTQYEVDKHVAEKERQRIIIFFSIGGCIVLAIALGIWIYLNRKITKRTTH